MEIRLKYSFLRSLKYFAKPISPKAYFSEAVFQKLYFRQVEISLIYFAVVIFQHSCISRSVFREAYLIFFSVILSLFSKWNNPCNCPCYKT